MAQKNHAGLELFLRSQPKVLVVDLRDDIELLRQVRAEDANAAVVILTRGNTQDFDALSPLAVLRRPLDVRQLLASVERVLGRWSGTASASRRGHLWDDPSPDTLLPYFERHAEGRGPDDEFVRGVAIIRRWQALVSTDPIDRTEFNRLLQLLESGQNHGTGWADLRSRIIRWGIAQSLTEGRPWMELRSPNEPRGSVS